MQNIIKRLTPGLIVLFVGCAMFQPQPRKAEIYIDGISFSAQQQKKEVAEKWWTMYHSEKLNQLIEEGFSGNYSLAQSRKRLEQAQALREQSYSTLLPSINFSSDGSHTRTRQDPDAKDGSMENSSSLWALGLATSYEVDLWGRVKAGYKASELSEEASKRDVQTSMLTLSGQIAELWLKIGSLNEQKALVNKQLKTNLENLELIEMRFNRSFSTALDVYQQRSIVESTRSQLPQLEEMLELYHHQLAYLLGKFTSQAPDLKGSILPEITVLPLTGIPVDLLKNRPDIQAAWLNLQSADWNLTAAKADRLPALKLTGNVQYGASHLEDLINNWSRSLAANLTAPIFDGGRRKAEVKRQAAIVEEKVLAYKAVVTTAVKEVEDAISSHTYTIKRLEILQDQIDIAEAATREATQRYLNGASDYLPVLSQTTSLQSLQQQEIQLKETILTNQVYLCKALGAPWLQDTAGKEKEVKK